jgi:hypothetical protein
MNNIQKIPVEIQYQNIKKINDFLENLYPADVQEINKKIKKYYKKYIDKRKIENNRILSSLYNIKHNYNLNSNINKTLVNAPRNNDKYIQDIYIYKK